MGVVYRAEDTSLGRAVALRSFLRSSSPIRRRGRFLREAKAAAALDHPGICTVYEAGRRGQLFMRWPVLDGATLRDRIAVGPLSIDESLDITTQVAGALKRPTGKASSTVTSSPRTSCSSRAVWRR